MACSQHSPQSKWKNGPDWKTPGHLVNNSSGFWLTKVETQSWTGQGYQVSIFILDISATQHIDFFDKMSTLIFFNSVDDLSSFFECFKLTFLGYSFPSSQLLKPSRQDAATSHEAAVKRVITDRRICERRNKVKSIFFSRNKIAFST